MPGMLSRLKTENGSSSIPAGGLDTWGVEIVVKGTFSVTVLSVIDQASINC
jgi:hypothetical protein